MSGLIFALGYAFVYLLICLLICRRTDSLTAWYIQKLPGNLQKEKNKIVKQLNRLREKLKDSSVMLRSLYNITHRLNSSEVDATLDRLQAIQNKFNVNGSRHVLSTNFVYN